VSFDGFSIPRDTYLPPEFFEILPDLDTLGEVKTLLVILQFYFQAGLDARPLTLDQIQDATGLSRPSVSEGLKRARTRGVVLRRRMAGTFGYEPRLREAARGSKESLLECHVLTCTSPESSQTSEEHAFQSNLRIQLYKTLVVEFGLACHVADNIAKGRDPEYVQRHVEYARFAVGQGTVDKPAGYLVASIRDDWGPPLGFKPPGPENSKRWYTDEEFEEFFEH
jgi:DNA-binding Lrp family transcriptional regulator